jgi:hypothetical protein
MSKQILALVTALLLTVLLVATPMQAAPLFKSPLPPAQTFTDSVSVPLEMYVDIPCANETVYLTGPLHILYHFTLNPNGGYQVVSHYQPQGVTGIGPVSGAKYQATGVTSDHFNIKGLPYTSTYINNFRIIGQGPGNNSLIHVNMHVTVNANGELTAYVDNYSSTCK